MQEMDGVMRDVGDDIPGGTGPSASMDITSGSAGPGVAVAKVGNCCGCCCDYRKAVIILDSILLGFNILGTAYAVAAEEHLVQFNRPGTARDVEDFPDELWADHVEESALLKFGIARGFLDMLVFFPLTIAGAARFRWTWIVPIVLWAALADVINLVLTNKLCRDWDDKADNQGQQIPDDWDCQPPPVARLFNFVIYLLFCYPHVFLIKQYYTKRVTRDSYPRQKSCCCCC